MQLRNFRRNVEAQPHTLIGRRRFTLQKLEHKLLVPVNFVIMPLFALANTAVGFEASMLTGLASLLALGIAAGLLVGKNPLAYYSLALQP